MNSVTKICRDLRNNPTKAEEFLWRSLRKRYRSGYKFLRQYPVILRHEKGKSEFYVVDFYCHEAKLIIEVDGGYHLTGSQIEDDKLRDRITAALGLTTLRFTNEEVMEKVTEVLDKIGKQLNHNA